MIEWGLFSGVEVPGEKPGRLRSCGHGRKLCLSESQPRPRLEQGWQGQVAGGGGVYPAGVGDASSRAERGAAGFFLPPSCLAW